MTTTLTLASPGRLAADTRLVLSLLKSLRGGLLEVRLPGGDAHVFGDGASAVTLEVRDERLFSRVLTRGDIGFAEAYLEGDWETSDLTGLLRLLAGNRDALQRAVYGNVRHLLLARLKHLFNRNSRRGSRRNIMAHYDLGNAFYAQWLDPTMSYSSALFSAQDGGDLATAQRAKYRRILRCLGAQAGQQVLEIGCGWGGFAELAASAGLQVTGVTLSPSQLAWARDRVPSADLRLQDYRDIAERFDHVVSIEMFEAVGERWWPAYFAKVASVLKPGGKAVIQSITIDDRLFADYRKGTDFIQQYVFPGGMLPSREVFRARAADAGLRVTNEFAFGQDYARTLACWRAAFEAQWPSIAPLGFDETFRRLWRFYLSYCEAGFLAGNIDVVQFELQHG